MLGAAWARRGLSGLRTARLIAKPAMKVTKELRRITKNEANAANLNLRWIFAAHAVASRRMTAWIKTATPSPRTKPKHEKTNTAAISTAATVLDVIMTFPREA